MFAVVAFFTILNAATVTFIVSCLIGALIIEVRARRLNLPHYSESNERNTDQTASDNTKQKNVHRFISFGRI
jgi:hypothetical protein